MVTYSWVSRFTYSSIPGLLFQALVYRDGNLVSGSLEALVQHMVPTEEYYPDRAYLFAFLLSARLFIKPHELLGEVCALCEHQQNLNGEGGKVSSRFLYYSSSFFSFLLDMPPTAAPHQEHDWYRALSSPRISPRPLPSSLIVHPTSRTLFEDNESLLPYESISRSTLS